MRVLLDEFGSPQIALEVAELLGLMAPDMVNKPRLVTWLRRGADRGETRVELRSALRALARSLQPQRYLEVGVRLGWSLAQVAAECPACEIIGIDTWVSNYGGVPNWGPQWVTAELKRVVPQYRGRLELITGRSQEALRDRALGPFDLICVDGDHTGTGALADLRLCLPLLTPGGALVFDDLVDAADAPGLTLRQAWLTAQGEFSGYAWFEFNGLVPVGVVIRNGK